MGGGRGKKEVTKERKKRRGRKRQENSINQPTKPPGVRRVPAGPAIWEAEAGSTAESGSLRSNWVT